MCFETRDSAYAALCKERDELKQELNRVNMRLNDFEAEFERKRTLALLGNNVRGSDQKERIGDG